MFLTSAEIVYLSTNGAGIDKLYKFIEEGSEICAVCGKTTNQYIPRKKCFSSNFTNYDILFDSQSNNLCIPCAHSFKGYGPDNKPLKGRSFIATANKFKFLPDNESTREALNNLPDEPFVFIVGRFNGAYQKHLIFRSQPNYSKSTIYIQYGEHGIYLNEELLNLYQTVASLKKEGLGYSELKYGNYTKKAQQLEKNIWNDFKKIFNKYEESLAYDFILKIT